MRAGFRSAGVVVAGIFEYYRILQFEDIAGTGLHLQFVLDTFGTITCRPVTKADGSHFSIRNSAQTAVGTLIRFTGNVVNGMLTLNASVAMIDLTGMLFGIITGVVGATGITHGGRIQVHEVHTTQSLEEGKLFYGHPFGMGSVSAIGAYLEHIVTLRYSGNRERVSCHTSYHGPRVSIGVGVAHIVGSSRSIPGK